MSSKFSDFWKLASARLGIALAYHQP